MSRRLVRTAPKDKVLKGYVREHEQELFCAIAQEVDLTPSELVRAIAVNFMVARRPSAARRAGIRPVVTE